MARTIMGEFAERSEAERAYAELVGAGFPYEQISFVSKHEAIEGRDLERLEEGNVMGPGTAAGAGVGAALGGAGGAVLLGLGIITLPVLGPLAIAGPIAAGILGASVGGLTGGIVGNLIKAGLSEPRARHYEDRVSAGSTLLAVRIEDESKVEAAAETLRRAGASDVEEWAAEA